MFTPAFCCRVIFNSRNHDELTKLIKKLDTPKAIGVVSDVTCPTSSRNLIEEVFHKHGPINNIICNVGSGKSCKPGQENFEEWQKSFDTNFFSAVNIIQDSINYLEKSRGSIVCISSICGQEVIPDAPLTYSCSKAALNFYIKGISRPLGEKKIRINGISPGNVLFDGSVSFTREQVESVKAPLNRRFLFKIKHRTPFSPPK